MSDHPDRPDRPADPGAELDELASAYVDGAASPEDAARVEADPALLARAAAFRAVAEAVAHPVTPPPAADRDAAIARAVAAADGVLGPAPVSDLAAARVRRERGRRGLWVASVAAAVLLVAIGVPVVLSLAGGGGSDDAATAVNDAAPEAFEDEAGNEEGVSGGEAERPTTTLATADDTRTERSGDFLGSFTDAPTLLDEVRDARVGAPAGEAGIDAAPNGVDVCPTRPGGRLVATYEARLDGKPVEVQVYDAGDGETAVILSADCDPLAETEL